MNRGPKQVKRAMDDRSFLQKAKDAWLPLPDTIEALAQCADQVGLKGAGKRIDYSYGAVSGIISGKYDGDLNSVHNAIRGAFFGVTVACPILGIIGRERCNSEQRKPARATNSTSLVLHAACRNGCPNYRGAK